MVSIHISSTFLRTEFFPIKSPQVAITRSQDKLILRNLLERTLVFPGHLVNIAI